MSTGVKGTLQYISPELQAKNARDSKYIDLFANDMWALGVSLYEMIYLKYPFDATNKKEYKKQVIDSEIKFEPIERYEKLIEVCKCLLERKNRITASKLL